jgi:methyl-accepting chemotaxis protein
MIQDKWLTIRFFEQHAQDGRGFKRPAPRASKAAEVSSAPTQGRASSFLVWRRAAIPFALLSALLFSSTANGQLPTTTALPYLLTNDGLPNAPIVVPSFPVTRVPPAVASSNIGSLLGGGLSAALTVGIGSSTEAAAAAIAIAGARKIQALRTLNATNKIKQEMQQDTTQGKANEQTKLNETCPLKPNAITSGRYLRAKASRQLRANARQLRANSSRQLRANDVVSCSTEEDEADAAEEQLEELTEVGNASEEAIEGAEEAAEAAEVAAEVAEEAAEAAEIAIDVFESILDALSLF